MPRLFRRSKRADGRSERGQALVEFSLVAILLFMFLFGIFDFVRLFQSWVTVQHAAREGARYAITGQVACTGITNSRTGCIVQKAKTATLGLTGGGKDGTAVAVSYESWPYSTGTWPDPPVLNSAGVQCDAIEVKVNYTHQFVTPIIKAIVPAGVHVLGRQRMVNEPFGPCT